MEKLTKLKTIKVKDCATMGCGYYKYFYNNEDKKDKIMKDKFTLIKKVKELAIQETKAKVLNEEISFLECFSLVDRKCKDCVKAYNIIQNRITELKQKVAKIK